MTMHPQPAMHGQPHRQPSGFSLTELMLALTLGSLLVVAAFYMYARCRAAWQAVENRAALEANAAFALSALSSDLRQAGFWGSHSNDDQLAQAAGAFAHCNGGVVTDWAFALPSAVTASNGLYNFPCPTRSGHVEGSDTLLVRYAAPGANGVPDNLNRLFSDYGTGVIVGPGEQPDKPYVVGPHAVQVRAWYLDKSSSAGHIPGLRRLTLTTNGLIQNQEIMAGVTDMQVMLGIDNDGDMAIDRFVSPDAGLHQQPLAVRIWLLLRTALPEPGHFDTGPWQSIDPQLPVLRPNDRYRRISVERTVWIRNGGTRQR